MPKTKGFFEFPNCAWKCESCQHEFWTFLHDGPPTLCPKCHSLEIKGGPEYHGGPNDDLKPKKHY